MSRISTKVPYAMVRSLTVMHGVAPFPAADSSAIRPHDVEQEGEHAARHMMAIRLVTTAEVAALPTADALLPACGPHRNGRHPRSGRHTRRS
jgi:hypothetical protein